MKKKKAIEILNGQIDKISEFSHPSRIDKSWIIQTKSYIELFFGIDSAQFKYMKSVEGGWFRENENNPKFLKECIESINNIGLYRKPRQNVLYFMPDWAITLVLTFIFAVGVAIGESKVISSNLDEPNVKSKSSIDMTPTSANNDTNGEAKPKNKPQQQNEQTHK